MDTEPLVSIVTPCYNAGLYIAETISSVVAQEYKNWEMIIVDDCSTDNSANIVKLYEAKDPRIHYICLDSNTGSPAIPRNVGIEHARGKYIALLDADDLWKPSKLKTQVNYMEANSCQITFTNGDMIDNEGNFLRAIIKAEFVDYKGLLKKFELSSSAVMFTKKSILGHQFISKMPKEDFVFWLDVMRKGSLTAYNTNTCEYSYRILPQSRSREKKTIIKKHWYILREIEKLSFFHALYYFVCWVYRCVIKYYK